MEVILLERIGKLGQMGDVVRVKDGFARNFLLPRGKALRATADNKKRFEGMKAELAGPQSRNERRSRTSSPASSTARAIVVLRQASESGQLFGSVSHARHRRHAQARRRRRSAARRSCSTRRSRRSASTRCRSRCIRKSRVAITVTVARSADEAERIARGEDVTVRAHRSRRRSRRGCRSLPRRCSSREHQERERGIRPPLTKRKRMLTTAPAKAAKGKRKKKTEDA